MDREQAWALLNEYNQEPFHLLHSQIMEGAMREFAQELGYGEEADFWALVGLLHDVDFERFPEKHCIESQRILR
ncbi:MAG TPA: hydrolase, partial [Clostridia bacterium]|nr:hydrolase [Clostridia bacterium]